MYVEKLLECWGIFFYNTPNSIHTHPKLSESCLKETTLRDWPVSSVALGQA